MRPSLLCFFSLLCVTTACTATPKPIEHAVAPHSPPRTTAQTEGTAAPLEQHAAALEQLVVAPLGTRVDRQKSVKVALPDTPAWRRVRFLGVKSLVGFRYGIDHHAVVGAFVLDVKNRTAESCQRAFEEWAKPWLETFEVSTKRGAPVPFVWKNPMHPDAPPEVMSAVTLEASTASMLSHETYHAAYAIYPAWPDKCLVAGFAAPANGEDERAKKARDRYAKEALPKLEITAPEAPTKSF